MKRVMCAAAILLPPAVLFSQNPGMTTEQTRALTSALEMGHQAPKPDTPSRTLSFEEADDPTVGRHASPPHQPPAAARKAAQKGEHLAKKREHSQAAALYREAITDDPQFFEAWNNLALELDAAGQRDEAIETLRRLIQLAPEHVLGFANLVALLCQQHRYVDAETVAREALKAHNYSFKANYMLGTVLVQQGKWSDEAKTKLEYAKVKYPEASSLLDRWPAK
jgi:tetratricopeptide (TPR) repeat protein